MDARAVRIDSIAATEDPMTKHANERRSLVARAQRRTHQGGAAMVEYSLVLFAVLICGGATIKKVGPSVACAGANATDSLSGGLGNGGCAGATASSSASGAGGSGSGGSGGAMTGSSGGDDNSGGNDESAGAGAGSGGGGDLAFSSSYDDGAGGLIGASGSIRMAGGGSSNGSSSNNSENSSTSGSAGGSGLFGSGSVGGGGGGGGGGDGSEATGEDSYAARGDSFASQVAGTSPQQIDRTLAKLSADVYGDKNATHQKGADGFKPLTKKQLAAAGITPNMLRDNVDDYVADVYTNGKGDYVVAYRGTMFDSPGGPITDVQQGAGLPTGQYVEGARLAQQAKAAFGNNVVFTGHSLGGGLAASSAALTGTTAVTFNAAGVSDNTLMFDGVNPAAERAQANNGQVRSYEVKGELLTGLQNVPGSVMPHELGRKIQIQDPDPGVTAAAAKAWSPLNPWPLLNREGELHGDYLQGLNAGPVKYRDANGKVQTYDLTGSKHHP